MAKTIAKIEYSKIKKIAWRFGRVFIGASLVALSVQFESIKTVEDILPILVIPVLTAGVTATAKAIREYITNGEYTSLWSKLPV